MIRGRRHVWRRVGTYGVGGNWGGERVFGRCTHPRPYASDQHRPPPQQGGREVDAGSQVVNRNPRTQDGEGDEGVLPGWDTLKGIYLGDACNGFNNLSKLAILWTIHHWYPRGAQFPFN